MGINAGQPRLVRDAMTRRAEYIGPVVNAAARITAMAHGGQVLLSESAFRKLKDSDLAKESNRIACLGKFDMPDSPHMGGGTAHAPPPSVIHGRASNSLSSLLALLWFSRSSPL
jgi:hypothetical protein